MIRRLLPTKFDLSPSNLLARAMMVAESVCVALIGPEVIVVFAQATIVLLDLQLVFREKFVGVRLHHLFASAFGQMTPQVFHHGLDVAFIDRLSVGLVESIGRLAGSSLAAAGGAAGL